MNQIVLIDQLIENHRRAIRYYIVFASGLVILGIAVIAGVFLASRWLNSDADAVKGIMGVGGVFVSSLSAFQVKEILNRKDKIEIFKAVRVRILHYEGDFTDEEEVKRIDQLLWEVITKTALG
jgi:hypothetical protein